MLVKLSRVLVGPLSAVLLVALLSCKAQIQGPREITVSAASDLTPAFTELGKLFEQQSGTKVVFNFGSTGQLAQQIEKGAPVDMFAAANVSFVDELEQKGFVISETKALYARGRLTIWTRKDLSVSIERIEDLARPDIQHIAIANPDHEPYGLAAKQALERGGVWVADSTEIVYGG